jgi:hypothetical protein
MLYTEDKVIGLVSKLSNDPSSSAIEDLVMNIVFDYENELRRYKDNSLFLALELATAHDKINKLISVVSHDIQITERLL